MSSLKVLISGGGIGGPALAFWLAKLGHDVTILERSPSLRVQGQQIDLRGQGVTVVRRMGLEGLIRDKVVNEAGVRFVNGKGKTQATFEANKSGVGKQGFTSEFEIMRGDLVRLLFDKTTALGVKYIFGVKIETFEQDAGSVTVHLSDGTTDTFDLLVGADGQGSKTRRLMLSPGEKDPFYPLGVHMAFYTVPKWKTDDNYATVCVCPKKRVLFSRNDNPETTQAYLAVCPPDKETEKLLIETERSRDLVRQKQVWSELFKDAGWQADRFCDALNEDGVSNDFYCVEIGQIRMGKCYKNRVALLGDAGYAPSVLTGRGTTCAFIGAYVLAGEISKHCSGSSGKATDGIPAALESYNKEILELMKEVQDIGFKPSWIYPNSSWVISILYTILWLVSTLRIDKILQRLQSDDVPGWQLPDYPGLAYAEEKEAKKLAN
ncbi:oxidoreductase [Colletotrichum simmondsii]|uniref:Oxidoreductase n=1 Tax=Colletotrichum simmondsii TaxID=703756 RepID=A0A135SC92_9PEZI|nr:oxidoreductase [Colletotrichum simmondsii]